MNTIPSDTTLDAARKEYEILRDLGPEARAAMAFELSDNLRDLVEAGVRHRHPDFDEERVRREIVRLMVGDKLYKQMSREADGEL